jgi:hypothetical protein
MQIPNEAGIFTRYELSPQEERQGMMLSDFTRGLLHNDRANLVQDRLNMEFTPDNLIGFTQNEAYIKGKIDLLTELLEMNPADIEVPDEDQPTETKET